MLDVVAGEDAVEVAVGGVPLVDLVVAEARGREAAQPEVEAREDERRQEQRRRPPPGWCPAAQIRLDHRKHTVLTGPGKDAQAKIVSARYGAPRSRTRARNCVP